MIRLLYLLAMFTGFRAAFNRGRSFFLPKLRVAIIDGEVFQFEEFGPVRIRVNARPAPRMLVPKTKTGIISLYLMSPGMSRLFYAALRFTSHFGHGHVEIAFYETHENVTVYAVRNILRSNIARLGLHKNFGGLKFSCDHDEIVLLKRVLNRLNSLDLKTCFASPDECVSLAVSPSLLVPKQRNLAIDALRYKYRRIERKLKTARIMAKGSEKHTGELTY
jgi:hypothetical protein